MVKRIALIGPESTGKTTLAEQLAIHYQTVWVKEYAREYLPLQNRDYSLKDIEHIARIQLANEEEAIKQAQNYLFVDTELIVNKIWCEDVFQSSPSWIEEQLYKKKYDLYLLTYYDLPWIPDPLRENPDRRAYFFDWYKKEIEAIKGTYSIITGMRKERFDNAITAISGLG